ncbi:hypothetical protein B0H63DRAFT_156622 [Podospora didyma]|uniref:Uncharacterized protein n=1 Tax=Podospora didyma TaxID=330526 RepID=A0AAE0NTF9_9PEZI|nr:hypothetical protein B0H63DRAFT_156622 [Podospora didyma]
MHAACESLNQTPTVASVNRVATSCRAELSTGGALPTAVQPCFASIGLPGFAPPSAHSCISSASIICHMTTAPCDPYATHTPAVANGGFEMGELGLWIPSILPNPSVLSPAVNSERPHSDGKSLKITWDNKSDANIWLSPRASSCSRAPLTRCRTGSTRLRPSPTRPRRCRSPSLAAARSTLPPTRTMPTSLRTHGSADPSPFRPPHLWRPCCGFGVRIRGRRTPWPILTKHLSSRHRRGGATLGLFFVMYAYYTCFLFFFFFFGSILSVCIPLQFCSNTINK